MNKKLFITIALLLIAFYNTSSAQSVLWAKGAGSVGGDGSFANIVDRMGNLYVTGVFAGPAITFGTTTLSNSATGNEDIFLVKYNAAGSIIWAKRVGGSGVDQALSIAVDSAGSIYMTGFFSSPTITFGATTLNNSGTGNNMFLAKYDSSGNVVWARSAGGSGPSDIAYGVSTDHSANIYITGSFNSPTLVFGTTTLINAGSLDIFLAKYDSAGNVIWAKSAGGAGDDEAYSIAIDHTGNMYISGCFNTPSITFGTTTCMNAGDFDLFLTKYDATGNVIWVKTNGGSAGDFTAMNNVTADVSGNVYVTGYYNSPAITFGTTTLTNFGNSDMFIAKYSPTGSVLWAKRAGGSDYDRGSSVITDTAGNLYLTGVFSDTSITFGTTTLIDSGFDDIFLVKYDASGNVLWAKREGGIGPDESYCLATDGIGNVYLTGQFYSPTITFDTAVLPNAGYYDMFVAKYFFPAPVVSAIQALSDTHHYLRVYPNPAGETITLQKDDQTEIFGLKVVDMMGRVVYDMAHIDPQNVSYPCINISLPLLPNGVYLLHVLSNNIEKSIPFEINHF